MVNELLYADDFVFMSKTMEDLKERFYNWKNALESKGLKVNTRKTKVMVSGSEAVMGFRGFARVRANPFLNCRDDQRTRSCFLL